MNVIVNGESVQLQDGIENVKDLLEHYDIQDKVVVVEVNGNILTSAQHQSTRLSDKDRIEIVHFVGGG
ncbi:sulfur carrier protein ThiS [Neobacillus fumarioli]|uniref:sulfur carrier protein ThiS n=1 Tax=Neobacillus fumarioli TaxID=105229 RepID=UPI00082EB657|nr:sulfur carrier protein ThiS [Neobacillus fumarioli]